MPWDYNVESQPHLPQRSINEKNFKAISSNQALAMQGSDVAGQTLKHAQTLVIKLDIKIQLNKNSNNLKKDSITR